MRIKFCFFLVSTMLLGLCSCEKANSSSEPKYIVQVSFGSFSDQYYRTEDVIARLEEVSEKIPLEKVLIGWSLDAEPYKQIGEFLHSKGIEMILYLPLFSEMEAISAGPEAVDLWGKEPPLYGRGGFRFKCPTNHQIPEDLISTYEKYLADVPFDGVFLDRIRTQSFVGGVSGVLNCGCELCAARYAEKGVDLELVKAEYEAKGDEFFNVSGYEPKSGFSFTDSIASAFFKAKGEIVSESVSRVADYFHSKGMIVGLDLYAPLMSQFVGQDYAYLAEHCDFIKPMLYRCTYAPAGISYEYDLLRQSIPQAKGYPDFNWDADFLRGQLDAIADLPCAKYPGIEIVYNEKIAPTDKEYIEESLRIVFEYGYEGAVVSWDIMVVPDDHIRCLEEL